MSTLSEALRYMQAGESEQTLIKAAQALELLRRISAPRFIYRLFPLISGNGGYVLSGAGITLAGQSADTMLHGCHSAVLMICSLGFGFEAELRKRQAANMAEAFILDACGSALVEEGCDNAEEEIKAALPGKYLSDRFSPGYGDLGFELQRDISRILDAEKILGVHLNESLLFYPTKTVSAIIGVSDIAQPARIRGCDYCSMRDGCALRKRGGSCGK